MSKVYEVDDPWVLKRYRRKILKRIKTYEEIDGEKTGYAEDGVKVIFDKEGKIIKVVMHVE